MTPWLHIIGIGADGMAGLTENTRALITKADYVIGGKRHHALIDATKAERITWPSPFDALIKTLQDLRGKQVAVLTTGDPLWFSVGNRIANSFSLDEVRFHPHVSAFQLAAARMGWALQDVDCLTAHGRPLERLHPFLQPARKLLTLTSNGQAVSEIATMLTALGYGNSKLTALCNLGGPKETRFDAAAKDWAHTIPDLNTLAVECIPATDAQILPQFYGLPDTTFIHDGTMTKQEVRAITLAKLVPTPGGLLWDVGCGCGSVAVEWMRTARHAQAIGIEPREDRRAMAAQNAHKLGGFDLTLIAEAAPDALKGLPPPDAIFIGGGLTNAVFEHCLNALKPMGRLVCNAVTLDSEQILLEMCKNHGGTLSKLQCTYAVPVGQKTGWKPAMPVTQYSLVKL